MTPSSRFSVSPVRISRSKLKFFVFPPEGLFHGLHHLVDVGHDWRKAHTALAQLLDGIGKGGDLLRSFRSIDLYIVIDFVILRLSHE